MGRLGSAGGLSLRTSLVVVARWRLGLEPSNVPHPHGWWLRLPAGWDSAGTVGQNTSGWLLCVAWTASQHGSWVPSVRVPGGRKWKLPGSSGPYQTLAEHHFHLILLVKESQSPDLGTGQSPIS